MRHDSLQFGDYQPIEHGPAAEHRQIFKFKHAEPYGSFCSSYCRQFILPHITGTTPPGRPLFKSAPYSTFYCLKDRSVATKCPVCMLLVDLVARHLNYESTSSPPGSQHVWLRPSVDSGGYLFDVYLNGHELGAVRYVKKGSFDRLLDSTTFDDLQTERPVSSKLIKAWMHCCQETHGDTCKTSLNVSSQRYRSSCKLTLVDTTEERLVLEQPSLECRYIALRYVWGGVLTLQATTKNLQRLQEAGSLNTQNSRLPQTVRDAMAVVSSLGERYLWVDVLCIIQDDEKSKALFISQMDIVYHHALLTIVAMSGQDANSGLPGLRPFTRPQQLCKEVDGSVFLATPPGLRSSASASRYEQRGWTLQERILSKRCLYFSAGETYYQCRSAVWQESSLARELVGARPMFKPPALMNPLKILPTGSLLNAEDAYQRLVERYTRRCLTFPSDKLNAFRGILGLLSDNDSSTWEKSGVPASFWSSLLWAPITTIIRRPTSVTPGEDPPTWSWLDWDGPVNFPVRGTIDCRGSTHALHSLPLGITCEFWKNPSAGVVQH
jgi:hypothetical protein